MVTLKMSRNNKDNNSNRQDGCDTTEFTYTDTRDHTYGSDDSYSRNSRNTRHSGKRCHRRSDSCERRCGLECSDTPVGVWNMVFEYDPSTASTTTTTATTTMIDRPTQLLLNEGGTFTNYSAPDLTNTPFGPNHLTTGVGVWNKHGERKLKLEGTHIAFKTSDGSPQLYYLVHIKMKLNHRGTKAIVEGRAVPKDLSDPKLCTDSTMSDVYFTGYGYKVLEPGKHRD